MANKPYRSRPNQKIVLFNDEEVKKIKVLSSQYFISESELFRKMLESAWKKKNGAKSPDEIFNEVTEFDQELA